MDVANSRSLGFSGKEILFRKIEFERYRKPHVVEYPRSAIVLNPQHTQQLKASLHSNGHQRSGDGEDEGEEDDARGRRADAESDSDADDDDPRRIDKTTLLCSDVQLQNCLHLRWQNIAPVGLGLVNLGNTCFANSVLQALAHVPALAQYFMQTFRSADSQLGAPFDFAFALAETFRKMHHANQPGRGGHSGGITGAYRPAQIMGNLRLLSKHFSIGRQSDAHEFAVQLLFACQKSLLHRLMGSKKVQPRVAQTTALYRICAGYLLSQVTWSRQDEIQQLLRAGKQQEAMDLKMEAKQAQQRLRDHPQQGSASSSRHGVDIQTLYSNTYDPFTILSVELAGHTLLHCLDKFCLAEELDGRCYHSPREVGVRAKKKFSIHIPPPVLMIHLKRFGPTGNKLNKHVQFPLELDITRYCTPLPSHAASSSSSSNGVKESREDCRYELNAICVHEGSSINYGHYYTMAKASNGMWYEFNDSHVSRLSEEQLQRAQAYMLCYSRVPVAKKPKASTGKFDKNAFQEARGSTSSGGLARASPYPTEREGSALPPAQVNLGRELSEAELQAVLEKRRREAAQRQNGSAATPSTETAAEAPTATSPPQPNADRAQNWKRMREDLPTDSDSEAGDDREARDGSYVRQLRPRQQQPRRADPLSRSAGADEEEEEEDEADDDASTTRRDKAASAAAAPPPSKTSLYGGLIKSMKRVSPADHSSPASRRTNTEGGSPAERAAHANFRVGRHAVSALHARKMHSTPDTVKRPTTAPKFQQRIRDPMWEMEMDRGKVKKVKSKEKAPDPFEGTNPFQEVSRGMFDVRGRRRRD